MKTDPNFVKVTENLQLRQLNIEDAERMALLADDFDIWKNSRGTMPYPYTYFDALDFINETLHDSKSRVMGLYENQSIIGIFSLFPGTDVYKITAEIGYWIGKPHRNKGFATQALRVWCELAFKEYGFAKLTAAVFEGNTISVKVLEKAGFVCDVLFKNQVYKNGEVLFEWRYSLMNKDFKPEKFRD